MTQLLDDLRVVHTLSEMQPQVSKAIKQKSKGAKRVRAVMAIEIGARL